MSRSTKTTLILSLIFFGIAIAVFVFMAYQVNRQGALLIEQRETMAAELAQQDSLLRLQRTADETVDEREQLRSLFLTSNTDSINFLNLVEELAPRQGLELVTEEAEEVVTEDGPSWLVVNFSFNGTQSAVTNFIKVLETLPYVLQIDSIDMGSTTGSEWQANAIVRVQLLNYDQ